MEKSTFDKNGIKRHELASDPNFVSVSVIYRQAFLEKNEAGVNPLPMTSTFFQQRTRRTHFQWRSLNNVSGFLVFSHFKKQNSTCLQQDQKEHEA